jgi:hypothetical protein
MLGIMRYSTAIIQYNPSETFRKKKEKKQVNTRERTKEVGYTAFHGRTE